MTLGTSTIALAPGARTELVFAWTPAAAGNYTLEAEIAPAPGETNLADNKRQLWVPPGFAHGFVVLSESADFLYKCTDVYVPEADACVRWDDPDLAIPWPVKGPLVSPKDQQAPRLKEAPRLPQWSAPR